MSEKRYYKKEYEEEYYIFDSKTLTEKEFEKKVEYDGYTLFADSLTSKEVVDLLNELHEEKERLKKELSEQGTQLDFLKDENIHMRNALNENKQLKQENEKLKQENKRYEHILQDLGVLVIE